MSKDKVIFYDDERLDIPDANALQDLIYGYLDRVFGGLIGLSQGIAIGEGFLISTEDGAKPFEYRLDDCIIYKCIDAGVDVDPYHAAGTTVRAGSIARTGVFVRHDRNINDVTFDFELLSGTLTPGFIWAKVETIETDTDTRRKWDSVTGTEITFSDQTVDRPYISQIQVTAYTGAPAGAPSAPDNSGNWCLIGRVKWAAGPIIYLTPVWAFSYYQTIGQLDLLDPVTGEIPEIHVATNKVWEATNIDGYELNPNTNNAGQNNPDNNDAQLFTDIGYFGDTSKAFYPDAALCTAQYGSHGLAHQLHVIRVQLARILSFDPDSTSDYYTYPDRRRINSDGSTDQTRFYNKPQVSLGDVKEMLGDADTCYKAREYDPDASAESEAWVPLVTSPHFAYKNPAAQEYFTYASGWLVGGGTNHASNWLTDATQLKMNGMTITRWAPISYVVVDGDELHQFGQLKIELDKPPVYTDTKGVDRSVQIMSIDLSFVNTLGNATGEAMVSYVPLRVYQWWWVVVDPDVIPGGSVKHFAPWATEGVINASDEAKTTLLLNYEYKIMDYQSPIPNNPTGNDTWYPDAISLGIQIKSRLIS